MGLPQAPTNSELVELFPANSSLAENALQGSRGDLTVLRHNGCAQTGRNTFCEFDVTSRDSDFGPSGGNQSPPHLPEG